MESELIALCSSPRGLTRIETCLLATLDSLAEEVSASDETKLMTVRMVLLAIIRRCDNDLEKIQNTKAWAKARLRSIESTSQASR